MMCYKDMTFCTAHCFNYECDRNQAWLPADTEGLLVSRADFSAECDYYMPDTVGRENNG